jgi:hypothetical protein
LIEVMNKLDNNKTYIILCRLQYDNVELAILGNHQRLNKEYIYNYLYRVKLNLFFVFKSSEKNYEF